MKQDWKTETLPMAATEDVLVNEGKSSDRIIRDEDIGKLSGVL